MSYASSLSYATISRTCHMVSSDTMWPISETAEEDRKKGRNQICNENLGVYYFLYKAEKKFPCLTTAYKVPCFWCLLSFSLFQTKSCTYIYQEKTKIGRPPSPTLNLHLKVQIFFSQFIKNAVYFSDCYFPLNLGWSFGKMKISLLKLKIDLNHFKNMW